MTQQKSRLIRKKVLKESQLGAFFPKATVYFYLKFKLSHLKNLKLFSIEIKELFEPIVLWEKNLWVVALFKSIFFRNRSFSNAR